MHFKTKHVNNKVIGGDSWNLVILLKADNGTGGFRIGFFRTV